jgi:hypothetical protein
MAFMEEQPASRKSPQLQGSRRHDDTPGVQNVIIEGIPLPVGTHMSGLYGSKAGRIKLATGFLAGGLGTGSHCYLLADTKVQEEILGRLEIDLKTLRQEMQAGRLVATSYKSSPCAQLAYFEDLVSSAIAKGARSLLFLTDIIGLARRITPEELVDYENEADQRIVRRFPIVALCLYDSQFFSGTAILNALKGHKNGFRYPVERLFA